MSIIHSIRARIRAGLFGKRGSPIVLSRRYAGSLLPKRPEDSNKATFGNVLNIAGSPNYRGAAILSSMAVLKTGAGYSTLACPEAVADSVASYLPDIVTIPLMTENGSIKAEEHIMLAELSKKYKALAVGCGLFNFRSDNQGTKVFFTSLISALSECKAPVVIDADGITIVSEAQPLHLPPKTIMTPHPMELSRLLGVDVPTIQEDRVRYAKEAALRFSAVIVLKGHRTLVTDGTAAFINTTGNSALAKAGTGDVLTGMIAGFCAQGLTPMEASCLGVYLHGKAGDLAKKKLTGYSVLASDLVSFIPQAIRTLKKD